MKTTRLFCLILLSLNSVVRGQFTDTLSTTYLVSIRDSVNLNTFEEGDFLIYRMWDSIIPSDPASHFTYYVRIDSVAVQDNTRTLTFSSSVNSPSELSARIIENGPWNLFEYLAGKIQVLRDSVLLHQTKEGVWFPLFGIHEIEKGCGSDGFSSFQAPGYSLYDRRIVLRRCSDFPRDSTNVMFTSNKLEFASRVQGEDFRYVFDNLSKIGVHRLAYTYVGIAGGLTAIYSRGHAYGDTTGLYRVVTSNAPANQPRKIALHQNFPNPFNPSTVISFDLPSTAAVNLSVFDLNGRLIETLLNENRTAGTHSISWNASAQASGVYLLKLEAGNAVLTRRMTLLK